MDKSQYIKPRSYEMMAVLLPDQAEEETKAAIDKVLSYITDEQGTIESASAESPWGRRRLAYTIRHEGVDYRDGHYVLVYFDVLASAIENIERELKLDTNVIRYLLLQFDPEMGEKFDPSSVEVDEDEAAEDEAAEDEAEAEEESTEEIEAEAETVEEEAATEDAGEESAEEEAAE